MNIVIQIFIVLVVLGLIFQRSKLLTVAVFFFIWTLSWNTSLPDYVNYEAGYLMGTFHDKGYEFLSKIFNEAGADYYLFRRCFIGFGLLIYLFFTLRYAKRCSLVSVLYMCTMSFYDIVQNRNFLGFVLCLIGISLIISHDTRKYKILYAAIVTFAATIHITTIFYMLFLLINKKMIEKCPKIVLVLMGLVIVFIIQNAFSYEYDLMMERYDVGVSNLTRSLLLVLFTGNFLFVRYWNKREPSGSMTRPQRLYTLNTNETVFYFNIAILLLFPAAFMSLNALRLYKYLALLNYTFVSNKFSMSFGFSYIAQTLVIVLYAMTYGIVGYLMHSTTYFDIVESIFYQNLFYN